MIGLEPTNGGTTTHCLNHLATPAIYYDIIISTRTNISLALGKKFIKIMSGNKKFFLNGSQFSSNKDLTLNDIIDYFNYKNSLFVIEYNNLICDRTKLSTIKINYNDRIEFITIVGGG